ncbi:hypothetical protein DF147_21545 [Burkholderia cenocepacia]|nr:hypothetical protein DF147_21545 [Burkholderia cenocepacia]RQV90688.1 hypothetical protein DF019_06175 [Burkholderia cenocepacia]
MPTQNPTVVSSPKPDYTDAAFCGALTRDQYAGRNQGGFVYFSDLADVARAGDAIRTISRLVHNSLSEPERSDAEPLGLSAHLGLLNAAEVIAKYLVDLEERMRQTAEARVRFEAEQEASHG